MKSGDGASACNLGVSRSFIMKFLALVLCSMASGVAGPVFDSLSGPLPKQLTIKNSPYLAVSDIEVPFGKSVIIDPGVVILFQNFTSFRVQGQLVAEGTKTEPIVFTSEFDGGYNPDTSLIANPFDWNGVYLHKDAFGSRLKYCKIQYSVYGVVSDTRLIRVDPCLFTFNGKSDLVIADSLHPVKPDKPYTYVLSARDASAEGISVKLIEDPFSKKRNIVRSSGGFFFAGGVAAVIYGYYRYKDSRDRFNTLSQDSFANLNSNTADAWNDARIDRNLDFTLTCVGGGTAALGAAFLVWTFTF